MSVTRIFMCVFLVISILAALMDNHFLSIFAIALAMFFSLSADLEELLQFTRTLKVQFETAVKKEEIENEER